jgi:prepilin-type N-terminal cleavage/methylation domain-containing protein
MLKAHSSKLIAHSSKLIAQSSKLIAQSSKLTAQSSKLKARRGVTLLELLVVVSIMMMLAAYALPKLAPMAKQRKIREAARSVSVFLSRAKSRAIETGRPCGVVFQRFSDDPNSPLSNAATMLYQAEVPPPYAGDTLSARVTMTKLGPGVFQANDVFGSIQPGLICIGYTMQINGQGPWYTIDGPDNFDAGGNPNPDGILDGSPIQLSVDRKYQGSLPWLTAPSQSAPLPFKILRRPTRTIAQPLTLPVGTAVDLAASGTDTDEGGKLFGTGRGDVIIMFSPNGSVNRYYYQDLVGAIRERDATDQIFLLIGWREQIGEGRGNSTIPIIPGLYEKTIGDIDAIAEEEMPNWYILSNLWVSLTPQSGLVTVAENAFPEKTRDLVTVGDWNKATKQAALIESRQYARRAQSKGGR